jgi:hypothetical protein
MKISYLVKNILLGFIVLVLIDIILNSPFILILGKYSFIAWLFVAVVLVSLFIIIRKRSDRFLSGFVGERDINDELKGLGTDFICKSDFDTGRGNIDKIVIGRTGVWTLEVKSYKGNIIPSDHDLSQAYAEAKTLQDLIKSKLNLNIIVQPVLVFSNKFAKVRFGLTQHKGVYVIQRAWLKKLLTETHNQSLDSETIQKIKGILEVV